MADDRVPHQLDEPEPLTPAEARALTDEIARDIQQLWSKIVAAYHGRAWMALNYASWDLYCSAEFPTSRLRLPREERETVVCSLRDAGLTIRAITSATGISDQTVQRDLKSRDRVVNHYNDDRDEVVDGELVDEDEVTVTEQLFKVTQRRSKPKPITCIVTTRPATEPVKPVQFTVTRSTPPTPSQLAEGEAKKIATELQALARRLRALDTDALSEVPDFLQAAWADLQDAWRWQ